MLSFGGLDFKLFKIFFKRVLFELIQKIYKIFYCLLKESFLLFILNYLEYIWKMINIFYYRLYRFFIISFKKHWMRFLKNMYHNIMDIDIDCPKPKDFVVLRRIIHWIFWIYLEYIFKHVLFESIQKIKSFLFFIIPLVLYYSF